MLKNYLSHTWRMLNKHRFYTFLNLGGLTLSFTCFFILGLYVWHEWSFDSFHAKSDQIYRMWDETNGRPFAVTPYIWKDYLEEDFPEFEEITRIQPISTIFKKNNQVFFENSGLVVDSNLLDIFDFQLIKGNIATVLRDPNGILLTPDLAKKYFGDSNPLNEKIELNLFGKKELFQVEGVINCPSNSHIQFEYLIPYERVVEHHNTASGYENWSAHFLYTYVLLKDEKLPENIRARFVDFLHRHKGEWLSAKYKPGLEPLSDIYLKSHKELDVPGVGNMNDLLILILVALSILGIGLINFVNLTTARAFTRARSVSIQKLYGANRGQLIGQFMIEAYLMLGLSMALALFITEILEVPISEFIGSKIYTSSLFQGYFPFFLTLIWLIAGILAGYYPGWIISAFKPISLLHTKAKGPKTLSLGRKVLSVFQITSAAVLIISTLVLSRQLSFMDKKELGFNEEQLLIIEEGGMLSTQDQKIETLRNSLAGNAFFKEISVLSSFPGSIGHWSSRYYLAGQEQDHSSSLSIATFFTDFHFVETLGLEFVEGRDFDPGRRMDSSGLIINEACLRFLQQRDSSWFHNPIGKEITWKFREGTSRVIGIVKDFHFESMKKDIFPVIINVHTEWTSSIGLRIQTSQTQEAVKEIEKTWKTLFPEVPFAYRFADDAFNASFQSEVKLGDLFKAFSILSIVIALLGLLGLSASMIHEKSREISIRKVVGASKANIILLLFKQFIQIILIANILAIPIAYWATDSWLQVFAFRTEWPVYVIGITFLITMVATLGTVLFHTLRIASINPAQVLSNE